MWSFAVALLVLWSTSKLYVTVCLFWIFVIQISTDSAISHVQQRAANNAIDICDPSNSKFFANVGGSHLVSATRKNHSNVLKCQLQILSCASCVIVTKIRMSSGLLKECPSDSFDEAGYSERCTCDGIEIAEPAYRSYSRQRYCTDFSRNENFSNLSYVYESQARSAIIAVTYHPEYEQDPFTIEVTAKFNVRYIDVTPNPNIPSSLSGTISTPFFPMQYSNDLRVQYNIKCTPKILTTCHIRLVFTDHLLASSTMLEVLEKKKRIGIFSGRIFRPPIIMSEGTELMINFYANKASNYGFRANYSAILGGKISEVTFPKTTCGGLIRDGDGGAVTMIEIVEEGHVINFDCIWILRLAHGLDSSRTHLFVKVIEFNNLGPDAELTIHKGPTSQHKLLQRLGSSQSPCVGGHVVNVNTGVYVSLKGAFSSQSRLIIAYATFSYTHSHELEDSFLPRHYSYGCYRDTDFQCENRRCIAHQLQCDGLDHCGDSSDERGCTRDEYSFRGSLSSKKNYYFPNVQTYPVVSNGFFFALCASFVTFFICSFICSVVYKIKHQTELDNRSRSLRQIMAEQQQQQQRYRAENGLIEEAPPQYDYPPSYNDVILYNTVRRMFENMNKTHKLSFRSNTKNGTECDSTLYHLIDNAIPRPEFESSSDNNLSTSDRSSPVLKPLWEPNAPPLEDEGPASCKADDENCIATPSLFRNTKS